MLGQLALDEERRKLHKSASFTVRPLVDGFIPGIVQHTTLIVHYGHVLFCRQVQQEAGVYPPCTLLLLRRLELPRGLIVEGCRVEPRPILTG